MEPHKNAARASWQPLNLPTLGLSMGGLGFLRPAPGTWGSLPPVLVVGVLAGLGWETAWLHAVNAAFLALATAACLVWGGYAEARFGRKDAAEVVADETAGVSVAVIVALCCAAPQHRVLALGAAFGLFRLFDVLKPWPARRLEQWPEGWGVVADDLVAGLYAGLVLAGGAALLG